MRCGVLVLAAFFLAAAPPIQAADLSPGRWPQAQRNELQAPEMTLWPRASREARGASLVTGSASPVAIHAGQVALRQGGSAADAAAVVAFTQIARNMGQVTSYAGKMAAAYYDAGTQEVSFLDGGWSAYADERDVASIPDLGAEVAAEMIGRQTLVPGFMRGMEALHARFGRLPWADLFAPAIWSAETGVAASPNFIVQLQQSKARFDRTEEGRRWLAPPDGKPLKPGDLVRQPDLARTLRAVARDGADEMYRGAWARDYVATVRTHGGRAALEDLARYRPQWRRSIRAGFADATVLGMSTSYLACSSLMALSLLDAMHVGQMGPYWKDPAAFRAYARAIQYATLRPVGRAGEATAFEREAGVPAETCAERLTPRYAAAVAPELLKVEPRPFGDATVAALAPGSHTMAVVVVDAKGNVAVLVHSTNGALTGLVVRGVPIPEAATVNKWALRDARPGDVINDLTPLIALRRGRPAAAVGATGTSLMPETVRLMAGMLTGPENLEAVTAAPPLLYNFQLPKPVDALASWPVLTPAGEWVPGFQKGMAAMGVTLPTGGYARELLDQLPALGLSVQEMPRHAAWTSLRGTAAAAAIDPSTGVATAVEVPGVEMFAEGGR